MTERRTFDIEQYLRDVRERPCFVCGLVSGDPTFAHHVVFEDEFAIAFLNKHPTLSGYVLVCPKAHLEQATGDMSLPDYLRLQRLVFARHRHEGARRLFAGDDVCSALRIDAGLEQIGGANGRSTC